MSGSFEMLLKNRKKTFFCVEKNERNVKKRVLLFLSFSSPHITATTTSTISKMV